MDYSASVVLPWHMASIPWVLSSWFMGGKNEWSDGLRAGWIDVWNQEHVVMPLHKKQVYHKKKEACHNELRCHFEERTLHRFARARRCSVWFTTLEVRGSVSKGVCNVCQSYPMLPRGSQPPGFGCDQGSKLGAAMQILSFFWFRKPHRVSIKPTS